MALGEVVLGMAHRGRLNVLSHGWASRPLDLAEFEGRAVSRRTARRTRPTRLDRRRQVPRRRPPRLPGEVGTVTVQMAPNPSHLEFVDPVVEGGQRGRRGPPPPRPAAPGRGRLAGGPDPRRRGLPRPGHRGRDAQPLAAAWLPDRRHDPPDRQQPARLHDRPDDSRSTLYASDLAKGFEIPIVHVNADDPVACIAAMRLAVASGRFRRDFLIDLIGYRRWGHNEGDEPPSPSRGRTRGSAAADRARAVRRPSWSARRRRPRRGRSAVRSSLTSSSGCREAHGRPKAPRGAPPETGAHDATARRPRPRTMRPRRAARAERGSCCDCRRVQAAPASSSAPSSAAATPSRGRRADRLGPRRDARFRRAPARWHADPADRPGHRARHLQPAPPRASRPRDRRDARALAAPAAAQRAVRRPQQPAVGAGRARLRVRLQRPGPGRAGALGGAVRRLRQRRPGDRRPVPRLGPGQVGPDLAAWCCCCRTATRARGRTTPSARLERFLQLAAEGNIRVANCTTPAQYFHLLRRQALVGKPRPLVLMTPEELAAAPGGHLTARRTGRRQLPAA